MVPLVNFAARCPGAPGIDTIPGAVGVYYQVKLEAAAAG
jgi:hypothetical protein